MHQRRGGGCFLELGGLDIEPVMAMETRIQVRLQLGDAAPGYPAGQAGQGAATADAEQGSLGQRTGEFNELAGFVKAAAIALARLVKDQAFGLAPLGDPLALFGQPFACGLRVGAQFRRYRHFAPACLGQQPAYFFVVVAGAGDHCIDLLGHRVEGGNQETGHRQRLAEPLETVGREAADVDRQQPVGAQQVGQVHVEVLELGQGFLQGIEMLDIFLDSGLALVSGKATAQGFLEPVIEALEVVQCRCLGPFGQGQR